MKKYIYLTCFVLIAPFIALQAQVNDYFQHSPQWKIEEFDSQFYPCIEYDNCNYYINGDSIINGLTYKKIYKKGIITHQWWSNNPNMSCYGTSSYVDTVPVFCLRSAGKKIYVYDFINNIDTQIYDFNLTVGSQLQPNIITQPNIFVTGIDSVYTSHGYRKRFFIANDSSSWLIEGVGSNNGLVNAIGSFMDGGSSLLCYSLNDTAWIPQQGPSCDIGLGVNSDIITTPKLSLFPNPATDILELRLPPGMYSSWNIRDARGALVSSGKAGTPVSVALLAPGFYVAEVVTEQQYVSRACFIKQ